MKETKTKTSLLSLTLEPRNKSLVRSIIILKTRTQNKRWAGFNDNLDFDDSSHEYPEFRWRETKHALRRTFIQEMPI